MPLALGLDLGSSGARLALVAAAPDQPHLDSPRGALAPTELLWEGAIPYGAPFEDPTGWRAALLTLAAEIPTPYRSRIGAIAIDGTSGTLLLCRPDGSLLPSPLHQALPYHFACPAQASAAAAIAGGGAAASASGSLARGLALLERAEALG